MDLNLTTALEFQHSILTKVSRSFALTIPQLPAALSVAVGNCYLWCRVSDTIEDDEGLNLAEKLYFHQQLILGINGKLSLAKFVEELLLKLSPQVASYDKKLLENIGLVHMVTTNLPKTQAKVVIKCVTIMNNLMPKFEAGIGLKGFDSFYEFTKYCYAVAGVVGETLTELFSQYLLIPNDQKQKLVKLARDFGQALQMTNILKDRWEDYRRKVCWLPQNIFGKNKIADLLQDPKNPEFIIGIKKIIANNYSKLKQAFSYTLMIPANEIGIRKFCLWAIGIAVATLSNINKNPAFTEMKQIKISKFRLKFIILITNCIVKHNNLLRLWFKWWSSSLG